MHYMNAVTTAN